MICPNCGKETLNKIKFHKVQINRCSRCQGIWFDEDELRKAKDERDRHLKWLDVDLWKENKNFRVSSLKKLCPLCEKPLYEVEYGNSDIKADICNSCRGIWLDRGEFRKIINYLKETVNAETLGKYFKHALGEAKEIFVGPEDLFSEIGDFLLVTKLLQYRFYSQYPIIKDIIIHLPLTK
ncbi:MAG: zf-TFIIB domain-containing protein [bacterium]|nr:zf-TFIIB domain-containing protein [bacterium]